ASSAESWATLAKSRTPRRSKISVRFRLPAPKHNGHSIVSVDVFTWPPVVSKEEKGGDDRRDASGCYLRLPINKPGSLELIETKFPRSSRVMLNMSLVRPMM